MELPNFSVLAHIQNRGNLTGGPGEFVGTRGRSLRMEGFSITFTPPAEGLGLRYFAHVAYSGDQPWVSDGNFTGFMGRERAVEGFAIELTGARQTEYDVVYMTHERNYGDLPWVRNGTFCGTRGRSLRTEGLAVRIVKRQPQYVTLISRATSASGRPLLITAGLLPIMVHVAAADGSDLQVWDRRPVRGGLGFALISKAWPGYCLAREGAAEAITLREVAHIDSDERCVWREDHAAAPYTAIASWPDGQLVLYLDGKPPYAETGNTLLGMPWLSGLPNALWRESETGYNLAAGTDTAALNAFASVVYDATRDTVFRRTIPLPGPDLQSIDYDVITPPRFALWESPPATAGAAAAAARPFSVLTLYIDRMNLKAVYKGQLWEDHARFRAFASAQLHEDRSLSLTLWYGEVSLENHPGMADEINQHFVPALLALLDLLVLSQIRLPPLELLGVSFSPPILGTQRDHMLAATMLPPHLSELPPDSTRWPAGKVFVAADADALNAVTTVELQRNPIHGDWEGHITLPPCHADAHYELVLTRPRFQLMPQSGNRFTLRLDLGGEAVFRAHCLRLTVRAALHGEAVVSASLAIDRDNHLTVTFDSVDKLDPHWTFEHTPIPDFLLQAILKIFKPVIVGVLNLFLHNRRFRIYTIPKIHATIGGRNFELTLQNLQLDEAEDGERKALAVVNGTASVRVVD